MFSNGLIKFGWFILIFLQTVMTVAAIEKLPDFVTVKGQVLEGKIACFDGEGIEFATVYGAGSVKISYQNISALSSPRTFRIYYKEDEIENGRPVGIEGPFLLLETEGRINRLPVAEISIGISAENYRSSGLSRLRTDFRHWRAGLSFGWRYEETAVNKDKVEIGLNMSRRRRPTRIDFDARYAYEFQQTNDGAGAATKDELSAYLLGEYDLNDRWFAFVRPAGEYDIPRSIEFRFFPAAGIGYRFYEDANHLLQLPFGIGYVSEEFEGYEDNTYTTGYVGFEGIYRFESGIRVKANVLYMPGNLKPGSDWLFRFDFDVTFPIVDPVAITFRTTNVNDNNPAPEVGNNKFKTQLALSFVFN